ncbi:MAG: ABC transporter permease, partial [Trueperaceae bacterium]
MTEGRTKERRKTGLWHQPVIRTLRRDPWTVLGAVFVLIFILAALFAPVLAPADPEKGNILARLKPPSRAHLFGTDSLGRDLLSRILFGARISGLIGFFAVVVSGTLGVVLGALAGYFEGWTDTVVGRLVDTLLAFPGILLAILILAILGPGLTSVTIAIGIFGIPSYARVVRGSVLSIKQAEFVEAARALGVPTLAILFKHVLRNAWAPV